jgi:ABC-type antimicrobial peptide transport system permease subunit
MREFGVRLSLGAERGRIVRLVLSETGRWIALGALVGILGIAFILRPVVTGFLHRVDPLVTVWLVLLAVAVIATAAALGTLRPALQAARGRPAELLRERE